MEKIKAVVIMAIVIAGIAVMVIGATVVSMPAQGAPVELSGKLAIAGSTTVLPINQECARLLMDKNPALRISISGGGSGHGVKSVGAGEIDIGAASRDVKSKEMETYPDLKPVGIGKDSVAIVVHPSNGVSELTMEQASKIFAGEIKNWKELGGADEAIRVITREEGSGTREVFEKFVMKPSEKEIAGKASVKPSNGEVRATVSGDKKSIGYVSLGYVDPSVKAVKIDGVEATVENVLADKYPIVRTLYLITKGEPSQLEGAFIDFVLSEEGQNVVEDMGYIKLTGEVTPAPTPKVTPTPTTTPVTTPAAGAGATPKPPGFEAVFAIAGLLAIAYAALRRRK
ncbi:MAG: phosphate ABC transporter substrate-binding protein PstS family protein [Euryarchaeota archaeon]|nr:phosphate ABC transporter substrate-binding protein PstS family protein [Euryarchaeota archaeon]